MSMQPPEWSECPRTYCQHYKVCANPQNCSSNTDVSYREATPSEIGTQEVDVSLSRVSGGTNMPLPTNRPAAEGTPRTEQLCRLLANLVLLYAPDADTPQAMLEAINELESLERELAEVIASRHRIWIERNSNADRAEAAESRLSALEADAQRYRALRDGETDPDMEQPYCTIHKTNSWGKWFNTYETGEALDKAIDAARKEKA